MNRSSSLATFQENQQRNHAKTIALNGLSIRRTTSLKTDQIIQSRKRIVAKPAQKPIHNGDTNRKVLLNRVRSLLIRNENVNGNINGNGIKRGLARSFSLKSFRRKSISR
ncbi:unnamed protein product [Caenorhabditis angaria]|uniref:Uncharacterized protein n=1 Tax=Caenorhabditis angaria TaxID=860376 RepID=A0A9P1I552_9PELO|nr:unnamed protein product [Caenorhabditis angaria]